MTFFDAGLAPISVQTFTTLTAGVTVACPGCTVGRVRIDVLSPASAPGSGMLIDDLNYEAVPEPGTTALVSAAGLFVFAQRLRARRGA